MDSFRLKNPSISPRAMSASGSSSREAQNGLTELEYKPLVRYETMAAYGATHQLPPRQRSLSWPNLPDPPAPSSSRLWSLLRVRQFTIFDHRVPGIAKEGDGLENGQGVPVEGKECSLTPAQACLSIITSLMGAGNLALPYAVAATGWVFALVLTVITMACCYTAFLLVKVIESAAPQTRASLSTYEQVAAHVLGRPGLAMTSVIIFIELFGCGVGYLILLGANLNLVFPFLSSQFCTVCWAVALYPTLLTKLDVLANLGILGVVSSIVLLAVVVWVAFQSQGRYLDATEVWLPQGLGISCGISLFAFAGHAVIPEIHSATKQKKQFGSVIRLSFVAVLLIFLLIASAGYIGMGPNVQQQFTLSLGPGALAVLASSCITVNVALTFGILFTTPCKLLETALQWVYDSAHPNTPAIPGHQESWPGLRFVVLASATAIALVFPNFATVLSLIGCVCDMAICFMLPATMHLLVTCRMPAFGECPSGQALCLSSSASPSKQPLWVPVLDVVLIGVGIAGAVLGTYSTLQSEAT